MKTTSKLLLSGLFIGPILFTATWLVLGFFNTGYSLFDTRIAPYSIISQPISGLGLGNTAVYMNASFIISGLLLILGSIGFAQVLTGKPATYRKRVAILLSLVGLGTLICGIFTLETFMIHTLGFLLAISPIITFPYLGFKFRKDKTWRPVGNIMISASPLLLITAIAYFASFNPEEAGLNRGYAGLTERILLVVLMGYYLVLGIFAVGSKDWKK